MAVVERPFPATPPSEAAPDLVPPDLGVDDDPVEVEDDGTDAGAAPGRASQRTPAAVRFEPAVGAAEAPRRPLAAFAPVPALVPGLTEPLPA